jgi:hypothetical protein
MRRLFALLLVVTALIVPTTVRADFITDIPIKNLTGGAPMLVTRYSIFGNDNGTARLCVSFRNVSAKEATEVVFTFRLNDTLGEPLREAIVDRTGSFGPGILIEGKMSLLGGNSDSFNNCATVAGSSVKPSLLIVDERSVVFADGTSWKRGDPFRAAYNSGGTRLAVADASPTPAPAPSPSATPGNAVVNEDGATATGGVIAGAVVGKVYGTIAWIPGSRIAIGSAVDESSQDLADYNAMSKCNALAPNHSGCEIKVRMHDADKKCGVIATDDHFISTARGPDSNTTIKVALEALQKEGGALGANNIVLATCNTH